MSRIPAVALMALVAGGCTAKPAPRADTVAVPAADTGSPASASSSQPDSAAVPAAQNPGVTKGTPPAKSGAAVSTSAIDTARGTIAVVGTALESSVALRDDKRYGTITLVGDQTPALRRTAGMTVWVTGGYDKMMHTMDVTRFVVRTVNGMPAVDGRLEKDGDAVAVVSVDGKRTRIANAPAALREKVGSRVWVTGQLDKAPDSFGVISATP